MDAQAGEDLSVPMTPAQMDQTVTALAAVLRFEHPADAVLSRHFREHPALGARDRALIAETVFAILRHGLFLEHLTGGRAPRPWLLAYLARIEGMNLHQLEPLLKPREREQVVAIKARDTADLPLSVRAELPEWVVERLLPMMGEEALLALGRALSRPAPLDLRVNTLKANRDEVLAELQREGHAATPTPFSPIGIRLADKPAINRHPLFTSGKIEVQDEGSQLMGYLLAPTRHAMVADFCAGAGGKTLMLGALMHSQGRLYAFDVSAKRLARFRPRLARSGLSNVHPQLLASERDPRVKRLSGKFDRVLVDAPCSGLGTLRRNPDLKWRQTPETVARLTTKQTAILAAAAQLVKPGGRLVYATCSILPEENENIVGHFLEGQEGFRLANAGEILTRQHIPLDTGRYLQLSPALHGTDGFFAAALERNS